MNVCSFNLSCLVVLNYCMTQLIVGVNMINQTKWYTPHTQKDTIHTDQEGDIQRWYDPQWQHQDTTGHEAISLHDHHRHNVSALTRSPLVEHGLHKLYLIDTNVKDTIHNIIKVMKNWSLQLQHIVMYI